MTQTSSLRSKARRRLGRVRLGLLPRAERQHLEDMVASSEELSSYELRDALALVQKRAGHAITGSPDATTRRLLAAAVLESGTGHDCPMAERVVHLEQQLEHQLEHMTALLRVVGPGGPLAAAEPAMRRVITWLRRPAGDTVQMTIDAPADLYVPRRLGEDGLHGYEPATLATSLAALAVTGGDFLDIGANVAVFGLLAATTRPDIKVVAFEPASRLADVTRAVAAANGVALGVESVALSDHDGSASLYMSPTDTSNSLRKGFRKAVGVEEVTLMMLDSWLAANPTIAPTVCKIDTESTEPDVLAGAEEFVRERRPWLIVEVLAGRTEEQLQAWCDKVGYHAHHIRTDGPVANPTIAGDTTYADLNWLFTPEPLTDDFWVAYADFMRMLTTSVTVCPTG